MQQLFDFLRKWNYIFLFVVLEAVSSLLLFRFNHYQGSVFFTAANGLNARMESWYANMQNYLSLKEINKQLTATNLALSRENAKLRFALKQHEYQPTAAETRMKERMDSIGVIEALVVSNKVNKPNNYIVIDRGTQDGIHPEMGVVGGTGIVGIVSQCGPHYSLVMPLINTRSNISCRLRGQEYFGYLQWDGRDPRVAQLDEIPRYAKIKAGMVVETSGFSAVFPPGINVGKVTKIHNSTDGQSYRLDIKLSTDFSTLRDVNIITTTYKAEIDTLNARMRLINAEEE